jgi:hypothetical protein
MPPAMLSATPAREKVIYGQSTTFTFRDFVLDPPTAEQLKAQAMARPGGGMVMLR